MSTVLVVWHVQDGNGQPIAGATLRGSGAPGPWAGQTNACGDFFSNLTPATYQVDVTAPGFAPGGYPAATIENAGIITVGLQASFPEPPSREAVCGVRLTFSGLFVQTAQFGGVNWFEPALDQLTSVDRQAVYAAKHAQGDTHLCLAVSHAYYEPSIPAPICSGMDWTSNLAGFAALVQEVIQAGFVPMVFLAGDGQGAGPDYNDHVGWTYGYAWLMQFLPRLVGVLQAGAVDLTRYVLFVPGFDGVFYGWTPDQVAAFGALFRSLLPAGFLAIEHDTGHIPVGNGAADWAPGGPMQAYDVVLSEWGVPLQSDSFWQVGARLLGPAYVRPPDQPAHDDPSPPFYLAGGTPRGPYYAVSFELVDPGLYAWVRNQCTAVAIQQARQYTLTAGYPYTG